MLTTPDSFRRISTCCAAGAARHLFAARSILPPAPAGSRCDDKPCNTVLATATHRCYTEIRRSESVCCFNGLGERLARLRILPPQPAFAEVVDLHFGFPAGLSASALCNSAAACAS